MADMPKPGNIPLFQGLLKKLIDIPFSAYYKGIVYEEGAYFIRVWFQNGNLMFEYCVGYEGDPDDPYGKIYENVKGSIPLGKFTPCDPDSDYDDDDEKDDDDADKNLSEQESVLEELARTGFSAYTLVDVYEKGDRYIRVWFQNGYVVFQWAIHYIGDPDDPWVQYKDEECSVSFRDFTPYTPEDDDENEDDNDDDENEDDNDDDEKTRENSTKENLSKREGLGAEQKRFEEERLAAAKRLAAAQRLVAERLEAVQRLEAERLVAERLEAERLVAAQRLAAERIAAQSLEAAQRLEAERELRLAERELRLADQELRLAERELRLADQELRLAEREKSLARREQSLSER